MKSKPKPVTFAAPAEGASAASGGRAAPGNVPCPCGLPAAYGACCGRYHEGAAAPTAEALMRSRYSAYTLQLSDYLLATWHPDTRPPGFEPDPPGLRWLGLDVRHHTLLDDDHATVEFVARSKQGGRARRLHETSRFVREQGRWFYVDGSIDR